MTSRLRCAQSGGKPNTRCCDTVFFRKEGMVWELYLAGRNYLAIKHEQCSDPNVNNQPPLLEHDSE